MTTAVAVRVLRDGAVVRELLLRQLPFRIGRDPECEVVLADDSVSRFHARVETDEDGVPTLRDAGSRNGLRVGPRALDRLAVDGRVRCRLGRVEVELEPVGAATTLEIDASEWRRYDKRRSAFHALGYLASALAAWLTLAVLEPGFWSPLSERRGLALAGQAVGGAVTLAAGGFALLVALRAVGRRVRMADAFQGLHRVSWLWPAVGLLGLVSYYLCAPATRAALETWTQGAAMAGTVALLASLRRSGRRLAFSLAWGAVAVALYVAMGLTESAEATAAGVPAAHYDVQAPIAGWPGVAVSADEYFGRVESALRRSGSAADEP